MKDRCIRRSYMIMGLSWIVLISIGHQANASVKPATSGKSPVVIKQAGLSGTTVSSSTTDFLTKGLVAHWTFDGPDMASATTATDVSGNGATLTLTNGPTNAPGWLGQAVNFDGSNDYATVSHATLFDFTDFTYSVWINPSTTGGWRTILDTNSDGQSILLNSAGVGYSIWGRCGNNPGGAFGTIKPRSWHHLAWVVSGANYVIYEDGVVIRSGAGCSASINGTAFNVGHWTGSQNFPGRMDDIRVYNRALTAQEILLLYNMGR